MARPNACPTAAKCAACWRVGKWGNSRDRAGVRFGVHRFRGITIIAIKRDATKRQDSHGTPFNFLGLKPQCRPLEFQIRVGRVTETTQEYEIVCHVGICFSEQLLDDGVFSGGAGPD
jgi:hypothetical protein